jgi:hypothetical protein
MAKASSPYYPPRARWYSPLLSFGGVLRRHMILDRIRLPQGPSLGGILGSLLVPGVGFWVRGPRWLGSLAISASLFLLLLFFAEIGYQAGNIAFGLLLSIHSSSLIYVIEPWLAGARFRTRIFASMALLAGVGGLLYMPARNLMETRWLAPLRLQGQVVVVSKSRSPASVKRNDVIAYSLPGNTDHAVYVEAGFGLGPVLAVAGDHVCFTKTAFEVNGAPRPRLAHMPESGDLTVPGKHWFVWPDLAISGHGNAPAGALTTALLQMAVISEEQFAGKPFKRWFWRRQLSS